MRFVACSLVAMLGFATAAVAETCVSETFSRPFPGATGSQTRHADVPSPRFPGIWQEGWIDGFFYRIWSNEEAVLQPEASRPAWTISVVCDGGGKACRKAIDGTPPVPALEIADDLGRCLSDAGYAGRRAENAEATALAEGGVTSGEAAGPEGTDGTLTVAGQGADKSATAGETDGSTTETAACGLATLPDGPNGLTLQRLLLEAGANPGPLDGFVGARTRRALEQVLGASAANLAEPDAISALDNALCGDPE